VRLDEPPVLLRSQQGKDLFLRPDDQIEPRRIPANRRVELRGLEDEQLADHLHPGRAGLQTAADDDVAIAERETGPPVLQLLFFGL